MAFDRTSNTLAGVVTGDGTVTNAKVASNAAIAFSKLAALTSGNILVGNGSNVPTSVALSGDATLSNAGVLSVNSGTVAVLGTAQQYTRTHNFTATTLTASSATVTWNLAENQVLILTLGANVTTWTISNPQSGALYMLIAKQDATGGRTVSFPSGSFKFPGGTAPTLTTTANKSDILTFVYHGSHLHGVAVLDYAA